MNKRPADSNALNGVFCFANEDCQLAALNDITILADVLLKAAAASGTFLSHADVSKRLSRPVLVDYLRAAFVVADGREGVPFSQRRLPCGWTFSQLEKRLMPRLADARERAIQVERATAFANRPRPASHRGVVVQVRFNPSQRRGLSALKVQADDMPRCMDEALAWLDADPRVLAAHVRHLQNDINLRHAGEFMEPLRLRIERLRQGFLQLTLLNDDSHGQVSKALHLLNDMQKKADAKAQRPTRRVAAKHVSTTAVRKNSELTWLHKDVDIVRYTLHLHEMWDGLKNHQRLQRALYAVIDGDCLAARQSLASNAYRRAYPQCADLLSKEFLPAARAVLARIREKTWKHVPASSISHTPQDYHVTFKNKHCRINTDGSRSYVRTYNNPLKAIHEAIDAWRAECAATEYEWPSLAPFMPNTTAENLTEGVQAVLDMIDADRKAVLGHGDEVLRIAHLWRCWETDREADFAEMPKLSLFALAGRTHKKELTPSQRQHRALRQEALLKQLRARAASLSRAGTVGHSVAPADGERVGRRYECARSLTDVEKEVLEMEECGRTTGHQRRKPATLPHCSPLAIPQDPDRAASGLTREGFIGEGEVDMEQACPLSDNDKRLGLMRERFYARLREHPRPSHHDMRSRRQLARVYGNTPVRKAYAKVHEDIHAPSC